MLPLHNMVYSDGRPGKTILWLIFIVAVALILYLIFSGSLSSLISGGSLKGQVLQGTTAVLDMPFDNYSELGNDRSTGNNDASEIVGATYSDVLTGQCMINSCLSLSQTGSYAKIADSSSLDLSSEITISVWIKPTDLSSTHTLVNKNDIVFTDGYYLTIANGKIRFGIGGSILNGATAIPINDYSHITATYDGSQMKIYINGEPDASLPATIAIPVNNQSLYIGSSYPLAWQFKGFIDDLQIYSQALAADQVRQLYFQNAVLGILENQRSSADRNDVVQRHEAARQLLEVLARQL